MGLKATSSFVWTELVQNRGRWRACEYDSETKNTPSGDNTTGIKQGSEFQWIPSTRPCFHYRG